MTQLGVGEETMAALARTVRFATSGRLDRRGPLAGGEARRLP